MDDDNLFHYVVALVSVGAVAFVVWALYQV